MIGLWMRLRHRAAGRLPARGQDRGSLALAILVGIIGSGIAAVLIPMAVVQIGSTSFDNSRTREMNAAEAGLSVGLGLIRSSVDSDGAGIVSTLPCTSTPLTGAVSGTDGALTYRVQIRYYVTDPTNQPESWLAPYTSVVGAGHAMLCSQGSGTYLPASAPDAAGVAQQVPRWATITATGVDSRGERTLRAIYTVKTTNANVVGGTIYIYPSGLQQYCMDAGGALPSEGTQVVLQPCAQAADGTPQVIAQQAWAYRSDLSIQLVSSVGATYANGLCLTAQGAQAAGNEADDQKIDLEPCDALGQTKWYQMWSVDDSAHLRGANNTATDTNGLCIDVASQDAGTKLTLQDCDGGTTDPNQTWVPSPDAGSGMAGLADGESDADQIQYVNFGEFSHCMDVTNHTPVTTDPGTPGGDQFLIAYTCKQNPNPDNVAWNQKFAYVDGELQTIDTDSGDKAYCLASPLADYGSSEPDAWVTVKPCPSTPGSDTSLLWWKYDKDGAVETSAPSGSPTGGASAVGAGVALKYVIRDYDGNCLSMTQDSSVTYNGYPKLIVAPCGQPLDAPAGTTPSNQKIQMWNASPDVQKPTLTNFSEVDTPVQP